MSRTAGLSKPLLDSEGIGIEPNGSGSITSMMFPFTEVERPKKKKKFKFPKWCRPFGCSPKKMGMEERLTLNWVQKWLQYGRFPWKFIFHALLTAACTAMVFLQTSDQTTYVISMDATWYNLFFPLDFDYAGDYEDNTFYFYNIQDSIDSIQHALDSYVSFPNVSVVPFKFHPIRPGVMAELAVESYRDCASVYDASSVRVDLSTETTTYAVSPKNLGPLNNLTDIQTRNFFYCMSSMTLSFSYRSVHLQYDHPLEYLLNIQLFYDNSIQGGRISLELAWSKDRIADLPYSKLLQLYKAMLDIAIIFLAIVSQILSWVSIGKSFQLFASARRKLSRRDLRKSINTSPDFPGLGAEISWSSLPMRTKLRFFNMWFVITILGNLANICAALFDFFVAEDAETGSWERLLLGIGTLLAWVNLVRYLEFDKKYTVLIAALQRGFPNALRFLLGTLPVFIGFALFGVVYFSETSSKFATFGISCVTLFGLQNGDDIQGTFANTARDLIVGRIYLMVFIFISIYGVANIFIAIMDESYAMSIRQAEIESLKKKQKTQPQKELAPNRESDLNDDDELWNAVLGISKSADPPPGAPPDDSSSVEISPENAADAAANKEDQEDDERMHKFMEFLEMQHSKFREETKASLETFMADLKSSRTLRRENSLASSLSSPALQTRSPPPSSSSSPSSPSDPSQPQPPKKKINFDLTPKTQIPRSDSENQLRKSLSSYASKLGGSTGAQDDGVELAAKDTPAKAKSSKEKATREPSIKLSNIRDRGDRDKEKGKGKAGDSDEEKDIFVEHPLDLFIAPTTATSATPPISPPAPLRPLAPPPAPLVPLAPLIPTIPSPPTYTAPAPITPISPTTNTSSTSSPPGPARSPPPPSPPSSPSPYLPSSPEYYLKLHIVT